MPPALRPGLVGAAAACFCVSSLGFIAPGNSVPDAAGRVKLRRPAPSRDRDQVRDQAGDNDQRGPRSAGPSEGFAYGAIRLDCSPADAAAVTVYLTQAQLPCPAIDSPCGPWLKISVWPYTETGGRRLFRFDSAARSVTSGQASRCPKPGVCEPAASGSLEFDTLGSDGAAGRVELVFGTSGRLRQQVNA